MKRTYGVWQRQFRAGLRALREARGLSQEAVAVGAEMTLGYYQGLESGRHRNPSLFKLWCIAQVLEVDLSELLTARADP